MQSLQVHDFNLYTLHTMSIICMDQTTVISSGNVRVENFHKNILVLNVDTDGL